MTLSMTMKNWNNEIFTFKLLTMDGTYMWQLILPILRNWLAIKSLCSPGNGARYPAIIISASRPMPGDCLRNLARDWTGRCGPFETWRPCDNRGCFVDLYMRSQGFRALKVWFVVVELEESLLSVLRFFVGLVSHVSKSHIPNMWNNGLTDRQTNDQFRIETIVNRGIGIRSTLFNDGIPERSSTPKTKKNIWHINAAQ